MDCVGKRVEVQLELRMIVDRSAQSSGQNPGVIPELAAVPKRHWMSAFAGTTGLYEDNRSDWVKIIVEK